MNIILERSLKRHIEIINQQWIYKSKKNFILLSIMILTGIAILISAIKSNNSSTIGDVNLAYIFSAVIITYSLTVLKIPFSVKENNLKDLKIKLSSKVTDPVAINITQDFISINNTQFINIFKWEYFKFYEVSSQKIVLYSNMKSIGFAINLDELKDKEQLQLLKHINDKALVKIR